MFVAKNNKQFNICDRFSKIGGDMFPNSELAKKYGARKTKTTEIIKDKRNIFSILKKPNAHRVCLRR